MGDLKISNVFRKGALYFLSGTAIINEGFPVLLIAYARVLTHLRGQAVLDTLNDLHDETENYFFNNNSVNVRSVSNAVLQSCRDEANGSSYYKNQYIVVLVLLFISNMMSLISTFLRPEYWYKRIP